MKVLIASGPTQEPIDPVRFISNYSTGVMGQRLVAAAKKRGHRVDWVRCPDDAPTALALEKKLKALLPRADVLIMAAAVCDARPAKVLGRKIKKAEFSSLQLVKNPDILACLSQKKKPGQIFIGFALESENFFENALAKLRKKGLDLIVLQKISAKNKPFGDKKVDFFVLDRNNRRRSFPSATKDRVARHLIQEAESLTRSLRQI